MINALGRRKAAVARIYVTEGTGKITINKRDLTEYFPSTILQFVVKQPLNLLDVAEKYDIKVKGTKMDTMSTASPSRPPPLPDAALRRNRQSERVPMPPSS